MENVPGTASVAVHAAADRRGERSETAPFPASGGGDGQDKNRIVATRLLC